MFFLGASANILVYLLVSAFFVVCLYIKDDSGKREMPSLLPATINYQPETQRCSHDTFYYEKDMYAIIEEQNSKQNIFSYLQPVQRIAAIEYYFVPDLSGHTLRAPPVFC